MLEAAWTAIAGLLKRFAETNLLAGAAIMTLLRKSQALHEQPAGSELIIAQCRGGRSGLLGTGMRSSKQSADRIV